MKTFVLDIETKPNQELVDLFNAGIKAPKTYKDPEKIEAYIMEKMAENVKGMSLDVDFCDIKCICLKEDDDPAKIVSLDYLIDKLYDQIKISAESGDEFKRRHFFNLVTFNGKKFDLPVIIRAIVRNFNSEGINAHRDMMVAKALKQFTRRYDYTTHVDLIELIGDGEYKSLDKYSSIYLNWPKKEIDFETCSQEELEAHCVDDVEMSAKMFDLFKILIY